MIQIVRMEEKSLYDRCSEREKLEIFLNRGYEIDDNTPSITKINWRSVFSLNSKLHSAINNLSDSEVKQFTFLFQHSFIISFPELKDILQFLREKVIFYSLENIQGYNPNSKKPNDKKRVLYIHFQSIKMRIELTSFLAFRDRAPNFIFVLETSPENSKFSAKNYATLLSLFSPSIPAITFDSISEWGQHRDDFQNALLSLQNALTVGTLKHCASRIYNEDDEVWNIMLTPDFNIVQAYHYIKELPRPDEKTISRLSFLEHQLKSYPEVESVLFILQDPFYWDDVEVCDLESFIEAFPFFFSLESLAERLFLSLEQHRSFLVRYQESILKFWNKCYFCLNTSYLTLFECISISLFYQTDFSSFLKQGLYDPRLFFLIISLVPREVILSADDDMAMAAESSTDEDHF